MARINFDRTEFDNRRSISDYRETMITKMNAAKSEERHAQNEALRSITKPVKALATDAVYHFKPNTEIANTMRQVKRTSEMVTGFAIGAALAVAAVAAEAVYNVKVDTQAAKLDAELKSMKTEYAQMKANLDQNTREQIPLSEYKKDIQSANTYYNEKVLNAQSNFEQAQRQIEGTRRKAEKEYSAAEQTLNEERKLEKTKYLEASQKIIDREKESIASFTKERHAAEEAHTAKVEQINKEHTSRVQEIKSSSLTDPEKERRILSLNQDRDSKLQQEKTEYKSVASKIQERQDKQTSSFAEERKVLEASYRQKTEGFTQREEGLNARRAQNNSEAQKRLNEATVERNNAIQTAKASRNQHLAETKDARASESKATDVRSIAQTYEKLTKEHRPDSMGEVVHVYRAAAQKNSQNLAKDLIHTMGTDADKALLVKYEADKKAKAEHQQSGSKKPFVSSLTTEEQTRMNALLVTFGATKLNDADSIAESIKNSKAAAKLLEERNSFAQNKLNVLGKEIETEGAALNALKDKAKASMDAQNKLNNPKLNLSKEQKADLQKLVMKPQELAALQKKIDTKETALNSKKKNAAEMRNALDKDHRTLAGLKAQIGALERNKGALSTNLRRDYNSKRAKRRAILAGGIAAKKLSTKFEQRFTSSSRGLQKRIEAKALGNNAIHRELKHTKRAVKNASQVYALSVNASIIIAGTAAKMILFPLYAPKAIGKKLNQQQIKLLAKKEKGQALSAGQKMWLERMQKNKLMVGLGKYGSFGSRAGKAISSKSKAVLLAPVKLVNMPGKLMDLPQTALNATVKLGVRAAGTTAKLGARKGASVVRTAGKGVKFVGKKTVGKAWNKTGKVAWNKFKGSKFASTSRSIRDKMAAPFKKIGGKLNFMKNKLKRMWKKLLMSVASFFQTVLSYIFMALFYILIAFLALGLFALIMIVVIAVLYSVFAAILGWLYSLTAASDVELKNRPHYIMHMAANYRYEELRIYNFFRNGSTKDKVEDGKTISLEVSTDPIFFELYDDEFHWFWESPGELDVDGYENYKAETLLQQIKNAHPDAKQKRNFWQSFCNFWETLFNDDDFGAIDTKVKANIGKYTYVNVTYIKTSKDKEDTYETTGIGWDSSGSQVVKLDVNKARANGLVSKYEISNAKDVLAIGDSIYQMKEDTQVFEILYYLGVGSLQMTNGDNSSFGSDASGVKSLFWSSHSIVYLRGTKAQDIYFHTTNTNRSSDASVNFKYALTETIYYLDGSPSVSGHSTCNNREEREIQYTIKETVVHEGHAKHSKTTSWLGEQSGTAGWIIRRDEWSSSTTLATDSSYRNKDHYGSSGNSINKNDIGNYGLFWELFDQTLKNSHAKDIDIQGSADENTNNITVKLKGTITQYGTARKANIILEKWGKVKFQQMQLQNYGKAAQNAAHGTGYLFLVRKDNNVFYVLDKYGKDIGNPNSQGESTITLTASDLSSASKTQNTGVSVGWNSLGYNHLPDQFVLYYSGADSCCYMNVYYVKPSSSGQDPLPQSIGTVEQSDASPNAPGGSNIQYYQYYYLSTVRNKWVYNGCSHITEPTTEEVEKTVTDTVEICLGHISLEAAIVVTNYDSYYSLMDMCGKMPDQAKDKTYAIYASDDDAWISGWGGYTKQAIHPHDDWGDHDNQTTLYQLAQVKAGEVGTKYKWSNQEEFLDDWEDYMYVKRTGSDGYRLKTIMRSPPTPDYDEGEIAWCLCDQEHLFYTTQYVSGEQKNLSVYGTSVTTSGWASITQLTDAMQTISFAVENGKPKVLYGLQD